MRAETEKALAKVFGAAQPHCAYLFANRHGNRMKMLVHDGVGIWLAARRLNQGKFHWTGTPRSLEIELDAEQLQALVLALGAVTCSCLRRGISIRIPKISCTCLI